MHKSKEKKYVKDVISDFLIAIININIKQSLILWLQKIVLVSKALHTLLPWLPPISRIPWFIHFLLQ